MLLVLTFPFMCSLSSWQTQLAKFDIFPDKRGFHLNESHSNIFVGSDWFIRLTNSFMIFKSQLWLIHSFPSIDFTLFPSYLFFSVYINIFFQCIYNMNTMQWIHDPVGVPVYSKDQYLATSEIKKTFLFLKTALLPITILIMPDR